MKNLTEGKLWKSMLLFTIPAILNGFLSRAYTLADNIIIGRFLGERCFAATASTASVVSFLSSLFWGYESGASIYTARLFGEKNYVKLRRVVWTNVLICVVVPTLIGILTVIFRNPILNALNVDKEIRQDAATYFVVMMLGFGMRELSTLGSFLLPSFGDSTFGLYLSLISAAINIGGNLLSVTVLSWGIAGVAFFSCFSCLVVGLCYIAKFVRFFRSSIPEKQKGLFDFAELPTIFSYSTVCILQQGSIYLVSILLAPTLNGLGTTALAAQSILSQIAIYVALCHGQSARAISVHNAQCMGLNEPAEKKLSRIRRALLTGTLQSQAIGLLISIPILLFPTQLTSIFLTDGAQAESVKLASDLLVFCVLSHVVYAFTTIMHSFLRGVKSMWFLYITTMFGSLVNLAAALILIPAHGILGVYVAQTVSWLAETLFAVTVYLSGKWIPHELRIKTQTNQTPPIAEKQA